MEASLSRDSAVTAVLVDNSPESAAAALLRDKVVTSDFDRTGAGPRSVGGPRLKFKLSQQFVKFGVI